MRVSRRATLTDKSRLTLSDKRQDLSCGSQKLSEERECGCRCISSDGGSGCGGGGSGAGVRISGSAIPRAATVAVLDGGTEGKKSRRCVSRIHKKENALPLSSAYHPLECSCRSCLLSPVASLSRSFALPRSCLRTPAPASSSPDERRLCILQHQQVFPSCLHPSSCRSDFSRPAPPTSPPTPTT